MLVQLSECQKQQKVVHQKLQEGVQYNAMSTMVEVWLQLRCDGGYDVDKKDGV